MSLDEELEFKQINERKINFGNSTVTYRTIEADLSRATGMRIKAKFIIFVTETRNKHDFPFYDVIMCYQYENCIPDFVTKFGAYKDRLFPLLKKQIDFYFRALKTTEITLDDSEFCRQGILS